jgi:hypothetical protein
MRVLVVDDGIMQAISGGRGWTTRGAGISMSESGEYEVGDGPIMAP